MQSYVAAQSVVWLQRCVHQSEYKSWVTTQNVVWLQSYVSKIMRTQNLFVVKTVFKRVVTQSFHNHKVSFCNWCLIAKLCSSKWIQSYVTAQSVVWLQRCVHQSEYKSCVCKIMYSQNLFVLQSEWNVFKLVVAQSFHNHKVSFMFVQLFSSWWMSVL